MKNLPSKQHPKKFQIGILVSVLHKSITLFVLVPLSISAVFFFLIKFIVKGKG